MTINEFLETNRNGVTNYAIAKQLKTSESQVSRVFAGLQTPRIDTLCKICKVINVSKVEFSKFSKKYYENN